MPECLKLDCCPPSAFAATPDIDVNFGIAAQLSGLLWELPCVRDGEPPWGDVGSSACNCDTPADQVAQLSGLSDIVYEVTLLFRGIMELMRYDGGTVVDGTGGYMVEGATPFGGPGSPYGHNVYSLEVSDPAATYYVNKWDGVVNVNPCYAIRYSAVVRLRGGATVTLRVDAINAGQVTNVDDLEITPLAGEPAIMVEQPYNSHGQFLQMDCTAIIPTSGV